MAIDFPSTNLTPGQVHTAAGVSWKWDGTTWQASAVGANTGGVTNFTALLDTPNNYTGATDKWVKVNGLANGLEFVNAPTDVVYANVSSFPGAATRKSHLAYDDSNGVLYYSNGAGWTGQRIVITNSTTNTDFASLLGEFETTYTLSTLDHTAGNVDQNAKRKIIRHDDGGSTPSDFVLAVEGDAISIDKSVNQWGVDEISIKGQEYQWTVEDDTSNIKNAKLRLSGIDHPSTQDITVTGSNGITVSQTDASTIDIRQDTSSGAGYGDSDVLSAMNTAFTNGTHSNVTITYDQANGNFSFTSSGGGGGGTPVLYDFDVTASTSNHALLNLKPNSGTNDTVELVGGGGTTVSKTANAQQVTIETLAYEVGTPAAASGGGSLGLVGKTFTYTPPDLQNYLTSVPVATASTVGTVKPGTGCSVTVDGTLNIAAGGYTLTAATTTELGGVKIDGTSINIDANGVISSTGGSTVPAITDLPGVTASVAPDTAIDLNITGYKGYVLYKVHVSHESWVRIYVDHATRQADATRSQGEDPLPGSGVIAEVITSGSNEAVLITPGVMGFNNDSPARQDIIYASVTNRSNAAAAITVTLTALKIGE